MLVGLILIISGYALGILLIHAIHGTRLVTDGSGSPIHVVLLTRNNQLQIEWYLRYLSYISWWKGRSVKVTFVDEGSTDETLAIVERFSGTLPITVLTPEEEPEDWIASYGGQVVILPLRERGGLVEVPLTL